MACKVHLSKLTEEKKTKIAKDLLMITFVPPSFNRSNIPPPPPPQPFQFYTLSEEMISLPVYYARHKLFSSEAEIEAIEYPQAGYAKNKWQALRPDFPQPALALKPEQVPVYRAAAKALEHTGGAIIGIPPGGGKTVLGTILATDSGLRTAIVVPRSTLVTQWVATYAKCFPGENVAQRIYIPTTKPATETAKRKEREKALSADIDLIITMDTRIGLIPPEVRETWVEEQVKVKEIYWNLGQARPSQAKGQGPRTKGQGPSQAKP